MRVSSMASSGINTVITQNIPLQKQIYKSLFSLDLNLYFNLKIIVVHKGHLLPHRSITNQLHR